ncbi:DUF3093 domain-containing protein [Mycetocola reblochoni]|uniref:Membrane protein n=2 Tax=Mycetocola reblochoni TaxID=331618 RepID=A0A1R4K691_9MICO|nr:DUF3093 domain-containing protein [Mycetocola reblochoni]RLP67985.1 DUF3093 domain-containing protein [Mycetocola reblochoni]SJN39880.1 Membrane protein [Mycetocola reblochoni REB411]
MTSYAERLSPSLPVYIAVVLVIPASILIFAPINLVLGVVIGIVLFIACVVALVLGSPIVRVGDGELRAGAARIAVAHVGEVDGFRGDAAIAQTRTRLDARAWIVLRGWVKPVVRVEIVDPHDPVPYWLVSSRHPEQLRDAILAEKSAQR